MLTLPQLAGVSNRCLVHTLLHQSGNFVVKWVKIWTVGRPSHIRREVNSGKSCWRGWTVSRARCAGAMSADKISRLLTAHVFRTCYFMRCHRRQRLTSADSTNTQENCYLKGSTIILYLIVHSIIIKRDQWMICIYPEHIKLTSYGKRTSRYKTACMWNELPAKLKRLKSVNLFKRETKLYLQHSNIWLASVELNYCIIINIIRFSATKFTNIRSYFCCMHVHLS